MHASVEPAPITFELPAGTKVAPTIEGRIRSMDVVRGVAVLGILLVNIPFFAGPAFSEAFSLTSISRGTDLTVSTVLLVLVSAKMRSMLAMLFGAGMALQHARRSKVPHAWPEGYLKRTLLLAGFGLIHGLLIWPGDILFSYSITAFVALWFCPMSERVLRWIIGVLALIALLFSALLVLLAFVNIDLGDMKTGVLTPAAEIAAFAGGSWLDQLRMRAMIFTLLGVNEATMVPFFGAQFLLGVLLLRHGLFEAAKRGPNFSKRLIAVGFGIGLPLNVLMAVLFYRSGSLFLSAGVEFFVGPLMALGYIVALVLWSESNRFKPLQIALANVGRIAFTCYILQSVLCSIVFYSWGFGLFGGFDRLQMVLFVPLVWLVLVCFAHLWLKRFSLGPVEWLWRSLTEGKRLRITRQAE